MSERESRAARLAAIPFTEIRPPRAFDVASYLRPLRELVERRELVELLTRRQLKIRYKDSVLGFGWSLIRPLTMLLIYYVAIGQFLGAARGIPDFAIFVFAGLTIWGLYSEILSAATPSIVENAALIKKVYLPREVFPLAAVGSALFNFAVQMIVLVGATLVLGAFPLGWNLLYIPVAVVITLIYGTAFALLLSAWNVYLRDIQYLVEVALLVFFWASPIVYSWSLVVEATERAGIAWAADLYLLNPMTTVMLAFQKGIWAAGSTETTLGDQVIPAQPWPVDLDLRLLIVALVGLLLLFVSQRVFVRLQGNFAQEI